MAEKLEPITKETAERVNRLAVAENFDVKIIWNHRLMDIHSGLTELEIERLEPKLEIVTEIAATLAAGMVKGTIKYDMDDYSLAKWVDHLVDEAADTLNYAHFARRRLERDALSIIP